MLGIGEIEIGVLTLAFSSGSAAYHDRLPVSGNLLASCLFQPLGGAGIHFTSYRDQFFTIP